MYEVSDEYLDQVEGENRIFPTRCKFDGLDEYVTNKHIRTGVYTNIIDGNSILSMGNACANKVDMTINGVTQPYVWKGAQFTMEKGLNVNGATEWVPWGTFRVSEMSTSNDKRTIKLTAYDYMFTLSKMKYNTVLKAPFHYRDLLDEFLLQSRLTLNTTAELPDRSDADYMILSWPDGDFTYSDIAGHLAGMLGCNARISVVDPTVIEFVWYTPTGTVIKRTLYQDGFEKLADGELKVDYFVSGANKEIEIENTEESTEGELDFRPFDSEDPADYPWLTFTYDDATMTASVRLTEGYENEIEGIGIPYSLFYNKGIYTVTTIEEEGFADCMAGAFVLPYSLTTIGKRAFNGCNNITEITVPENVTTLSSYTWGQCENLETVYWNAINVTEISTDATYSTFAGCPKLKNFIFGQSVTTIPECLMSNCSLVERVVLPDSVTNIGRNAFRNCAGLKDITIPENVTMIYGTPFFGCSNLETVYWNATNCARTSGGYNSVFYQSAVKNVIFGNNVELIPEYALAKLTTITSVILPFSLTTIGNYAFTGCTGLTSMTITENVTTVGNLAFQNCSKLATVYWNALNASCGSTPFKGCSVLTRFVFGDRVATVAKNVLNGVTTITSVTIPESATTIGESAFANCTGLTSITIPDKVSTIEKYAFRYCSGLTSVQIGVSANCAISSIGSAAFGSATALTSITIYAATGGVSGSPWGASNATVTWMIGE